MSRDPLGEDPDFRFLCVDRRRLLAEQTKPFDGRKNCWIPDPKHGYVRAEIQTARGQEVSVLTDNMEVTATIVPSF